MTRAPLPLRAEAAPWIEGAQDSLLGALGVAVYTTDAEGRLTAYNEAAVALWGWRPPLGDTRWCGSWRLRRPDGTPLPHAECPMATCLQEGLPVRSIEAIAERPDGTRIPFIPYPTPLRDASGQLLGAVNVLVDISDRHAAEAALAGSAARLRAVFETTPECIKLVAPDGTLMQMNRAGLGMIEADAAEMVEGRCVFDLIAPEHRPAWRACHERVCQGEALHWEFDIVGLRGTRRRMETHATPLRLPGGQTAQLAITRDVTARKEAEERQLLLMREVDHRAKNALAVALSLIRLTRADDPGAFAAAVEGRIAALAHAHSLLAAQSWQGAELSAVIQAELAPFLTARRIELRGPPVWLTADTVQPLSMMLHELTTNAATFGALSAPAGKVAVSWDLAPDSRRLELTWEESGGPPIESWPRRQGFGSKLIASTVRSQLGGEIRHYWGPEGLRCEIVLPADRLQARHDTEHQVPEATDGSGAPSAGRLAGRRVLLVEDELLVAMEMEKALRELDCEVLGPAATVDEAMRLAQAEMGRIDAAVLDVNLAGRPSFPVADLLSGLGVPVLFATGYGDLPDGQVAGAVNLLLRKPLGRGEVEAALSRLLSAAPPAAARQAG